MGVFFLNSAAVSIFICHCPYDMFLGLSPCLRVYILYINMHSDHTNDVSIKSCYWLTLTYKISIFSNGLPHFFGNIFIKKNIHMLTWISFRRLFFKLVFIVSIAAPERIRAHPLRPSLHLRHVSLPSSWSSGHPWS